MSDTTAAGKPKSQQQKWQERQVAAGNCQGCGKPRGQLSRRWCDVCVGRRRATAKKRVKKLHALSDPPVLVETKTVTRAEVALEAGPTYVPTFADLDPWPDITRETAPEVLKQIESTPSADEESESVAAFRKLLGL